MRRRIDCRDPRMADVNAGARRACVVVIGQPYRGRPADDTLFAVSTVDLAHSALAPMLTIQLMPNLSVHWPNSSPHICFSSGIVTVPPSESWSQ